MVAGRRGARYAGATVFCRYVTLVFVVFQLTRDVRTFDRERPEGIRAAAWLGAYVLARLPLLAASAVTYSLPVFLLAGLRGASLAAINPATVTSSGSKTPNPYGTRHLCKREPRPVRRGDGSFLVLKTPSPYRRTRPLSAGESLGEFLLVSCAMPACSFAVAIVCVGAARDFETASLMGNSIFTFLVIPSGYLVNPSTLGAWARWWGDLSYVKFGFTLFAHAEYDGAEYDGGAVTGEVGGRRGLAGVEGSSGPFTAPRTMAPSTTTGP